MQAEQVDRKRYKNRSGKSGVLEYAPGPNSICVWFVDGSGYVYDDSRPGRQHVSEMRH
jgi:hypothetical protein